MHANSGLLCLVVCMLVQLLPNAAVVCSCCALCCRSAAGLMHRAAFLQPHRLLLFALAVVVRLQVRSIWQCGWGCLGVIPSALGWRSLAGTPRTCCTEFCSEVAATTRDRCEVSGCLVCHAAVYEVVRFPWTKIKPRKPACMYMLEYVGLVHNLWMVRQST